MTKPKKPRLPYRVTLGGILGVLVAIGLALALFRHAVMSVCYADGFPIINLWAVFGGTALLGGAVGAPIGQIFRDERGGMALMGAFIGAVVAPLLLVLGFVAFVAVLLCWG
jgi:hypothetical protein